MLFSGADHRLNLEAEAEGAVVIVTEVVVAVAAAAAVVAKNLAFPVPGEVREVAGASKAAVLPF